ARSRALGAARPTHAGAPEHDPGATGRLRDDRTVDCRRRTRVSKSQRQSARTPLSPVAAGAPPPPPPPPAPPGPPPAAPSPPIPPPLSPGCALPPAPPLPAVLAVSAQPASVTLDWNESSPIDEPPPEPGLPPAPPHPP